MKAQEGPAGVRHSELKRVPKQCAFASLEFAKPLPGPFFGA